MKNNSIKVISVERTEEGHPLKVTLEWEGKRIKFLRKGDKAVEVLREVLYTDRSEDQIYFPDSIYKKFLKIAYTILFPKSHPPEPESPKQLKLF